MARFEVQARVLDLLGLQQIANCPTAISELFKNSWDAYAERVKLDVFPEQNQAILWDDGIGMTETELLHRWLVVGAAGKEDLPASVTPPEGMVPRPIQGEKGIGRLAISTLGDTLLLISRSREPTTQREPYVALLINWNIVQNEHLRLSDLEFPSLTFTNPEDLGGGIVADMAGDLRRALLSPEQSYAWETLEGAAKRDAAVALRTRIIDQLESFKVDMSNLLRAFSESNKKYGTIFLIGHLKDEFYQYVRRPRRDGGSQEPNNELVELLSNFRNSFELGFGGSDQGIRLDADIRVWDSQRRVFASLFEETAAFEAEDLRSYDHYIDVRFDAFGRFTGDLEIYGKPVALPARDLQTKRALQAGPFRLRLWYYQDKKDSRLDPDQWALLSKKLNSFGGVMIYRDGLRVLPYGRPVFDWLQIEERRTRGLGYYFFSYRRMFGYVSITHKDNPHLLDKAGREGLIQNSAYRDLRQCLETFFIYLARQYFKKGTAFFEQKQQLSDERKKVDEERKRAAEKRKELKEEAALKLTLIREKVPEQLELAFRDGLQRLETMDTPNVADLTDTLLRFEDRIAQIEGSVRFVVPRNLSIRRDRELNRLKHDHEIAFKAVESECATLRVRFERSVQDRFPDARHAASRQRALDKTYAQALASIGKANKALRVELDARITSLTLGLDELYNRLRVEVEEILRSASHPEETGSVESEGFAEAMAAMGAAATKSVETLREHQERLSVYFTRYFGETRDDLIAAQTGEIDELREQVDRDLELVQLGLAVEIIDHDLNKLFLGIRSNLTRLLSLLRNTPRAMRYLEDLRSSFNHLQQRFRQMSPIYRGSYRAKSEIDGRRILAYCRDFLGHQLRTVGVNLDASVAFASFRILEAEAVILPVFVNVIDNSIYWLRESADKRILLDRHGDVVTICDSGPGIHATEFADIFEPFVSNKPSGRGLGLYIARANLKRYGHEIWATDDPAYRTLAGACICIRFHHDVIESE